MTDIVELLRAENANPRNWRRMYGEASDEIETLREALSQILDVLRAWVRILIPSTRQKRSPAPC
jgi:hypothetical protein